jgi:diguanylate cyclase (GGDEF)-like protein
VIVACAGPDEEARLAALKGYQVLDTAPEETFDRITRLATAVLQVPIALVSLIDRDRQWFKSHQGLAASQTPRDFSFCAHAIEQSEPLIVRDATLDPRFADNPLVTGDPYIRFYLGVQLVDRNGFNLGTICCIDRTPRNPTPDQIAILQDLARIVVDSLEMRLLAATDSLTGAMTRRAFLEVARRDIGFARRHARPLACVLIDADHFKAINDTHGHAAGDLALRRLVSICNAQLRSTDYICRYGGEEFAGILRETDLVSGFSVAERLRTGIESERFTIGGATFGLTVSIGVSILTSHDTTPEELLNKADLALYEAKTTGRNRTVCSSEEGRKGKLDINPARLNVA